jgi:adenine-specific DNA-methyltransferase
VEVAYRLGREINMAIGMKCIVLGAEKGIPQHLPDYCLWHGDVEAFLNLVPETPLFDLIVSSPPYNIGKPYEDVRALHEYLEWQERIIHEAVVRLKPTGSICWQVGNHIIKGRNARGNSILPLDIEFHPIFLNQGLKLRNRIIWTFGHGLHCKYRFSGRYETVLWYTKTDDYLFNLDDVRVDAKYPGKRNYKGPNRGQFSGNPLGKNPEDVWQIPNVKSNHVEKTNHPCQFPVALIDRLVQALTNTGGVVFDPFAGVASAGVAAALRQRSFVGCETQADYVSVGKERIDLALAGKAKVRPLDRPIYDHTQSNLSKKPEELQ